VSKTGVRILGLDPGSVHTGYGLVEKSGSRVRQLDCGRLSCRRGMSLPERLGFLARELDRLIDRTQPELAVLEALFHGRNTRSLIVLAQARGALLSVLARRDLEVREYSPAEVKSAITGNGRAGKEQVSRMVGLLLGVDGEKLTADATDALAVALCGARRQRFDRLRSRLPTGDRGTGVSG
jgi:crossover junction endodeoxyribonuclease RuvC